MHIRDFASTPALTTQSSARKTALGATLVSSFLAVSGSATADSTAPHIIPVEGYLNAALVDRTIENIRALRQQDPNSDIRIEIGDTRGGELEAGFRLSHEINSAGNIDLVCEGNLQSMAANLFVSYQGGERIAGEDCTNFMLHDIVYTVQTQSIGSASFVRSYVDGMMENLRIPFDMMTQATANAADMPIESAQALFGEDCHLTPDKAYSIGLLDHFEMAVTSLPARLESPSPDQIYNICGTQPLSSYFSYTDWSRYEFNGVPAPN